MKGGPCFCRGPPPAFDSLADYHQNYVLHVAEGLRLTPENALLLLHHRPERRLELDSGLRRALDLNGQVFLEFLSPFFPAK